MNLPNHAIKIEAQNSGPESFIANLVSTVPMLANEIVRKVC